MVPRPRGNFLALLALTAPMLHEVALCSIARVIGWCAACQFLLSSMVLIGAPQLCADHYVSFLQDNMLDRIPDERKDQARGHRDRAHEFFTEEYFPEERRDQFIYRLKKVCLVTHSSHQRCCY
jgi:hypothetical protein